MSDDLVKRLRDAADRAKREYPEVFRVSEEITYEAADRIEKLEAALREIADGPRDADKSYVSLFYEIQSEARKALEGKDD